MCFIRGRLWKTIFPGSLFLMNQWSSITKVPTISKFIFHTRWRAIAISSESIILGIKTPTYTVDHENNTVMVFFCSTSSIATVKEGISSDYEAVLKRFFRNSERILNLHTWRTVLLWILSTIKMEYELFRIYDSTLSCIAISLASCCWFSEGNIPSVIRTWFYSTLGVLILP